MKKRIYTPGTLNPRMPTLVISLSALVMVTFAVFAPGTVAAADTVLVAGVPEAMATHCSDTLAEPNAFWNGIYFDCSTASADDSVSANHGPTELRRTYGSNSFNPAATANPSADADQGYVGEWRGTIVTAQSGVVAAGSDSFVRSATTNPSSDANEGYVGEWRGTIVTAQSGVVAAGSDSFVRSATANPSSDANEGYVGEWRGTIITAQNGVGAAGVTANSGPLWMGRTYGYD